MLIQMPGSPEPGPQKAEDCSAFQAGLRRDLAAAQLVSYDGVLGGWPKRVVDFSLTLMSAPAWAPLMLLAAGWAKLRGRRPVFRGEEKVGYGGRVFTRWSLNLRADADEDANDPGPANDLEDIAKQAESRRAKWRRAFERLPHLLNVLIGDMALVGPSPLAPVQLEPLKSGMRHYLSARPGVVGVGALAASGEDRASQYKLYARSWDLGVDMLILWDALSSLRNRGELWSPRFSLKNANPRVVAPQAVLERRRRAS